MKRLSIRLLAAAFALSTALSLGECKNTAPMDKAAEEPKYDVAYMYIWGEWGYYPIKEYTIVNENLIQVKLSDNSQVLIDTDNMVLIKNGDWSNE